MESSGHALHVFINGKLCGSIFGTREDRRISYREKIRLLSGRNKIALLSVAMGLSVSFLCFFIMLIPNSNLT